MPAGVSSSASPAHARTNNVSVTSINCANSATLTATAIGDDDATTTTSTIASQVDATNLTTTPSSSSSISNSINSNSNNSTNVVGNEQSPSAAALNNGNHFYGNGSIRISVPKMEESDESETELSNIESTAAAAAVANSVSMRASINKNAPRPMSWEGELSDSDDRMETENVASPTGNGHPGIVENCTNANSSALIDATSIANNGNDQINVITYATSDKTQTTQRQLSAHSDNGQSHLTMQLLPKDAIKPEYVDNMPMYGGVSTPSKRYPIDMTSLKYEVQQTSHQYQQSDAINSPLLARSKNTLLPANPSPDSAIHSVYTHSSPSQSPLTSRHTPYTPSLSRNNSDASYSSCYSYSSEFSPTHSPIQGRHNMYAGGGGTGAGSNFNGSPLHHSVLYKPLMDGNNGPAGDNGAKIGQQQQPPQHVQEDSILEAEAIPSAGISRQQLINR